MKAIFPDTAAAAAPRSNERQAIKPEFIRLPKSGSLCPWTGLSRSKMNELVLPSAANDYKPAVGSKVLRKRGQIRGCRLIVFDSLIEFLHSQTGGEGEGEDHEKRHQAMGNLLSVSLGCVQRD